jgi:CopG family transcriptional regulator, nickel-responsive regulator
VAELKRIGIAIDGDLLEKFDSLIQEQGYVNRSEAFRDLIRADLVNRVTRSKAVRVVGTLTLVYNHHARLLTEKLTEVQHEFHHLILSTIHAHLDHDNCLEVLLLRGRAENVEAFANRLIATKGIKHGKLVVAAADEGSSVDSRREKSKHAS